MKTNLIIIIIFLAAAGCVGGSSRLRERLDEIDKLADKEPKAAMAALDSIGNTGMSESDKHYFDLLTIKAKDKAYITHTSDSLILTTIDYYETNHDDRLTPMALYYGGRVYSDLGDYPTALHYFQQAIDLLEQTSTYIHLQSAIFTQTAWILDRMRLYDQAIMYLEKNVKVDETLRDTIGMVMDLQLLGGIYTWTNRHDDAKRCINMSLRYSKDLPTHYDAKAKLYLAINEYKLGNINTSLKLIRDVLPKVKPMTRHLALASASEIYLAAGIKDTSYMYAHELIHNPEFLNRKTGYKILLSPELRSMIHPDSIDRYFTEYRNTLEEFFDENQKELVNTQMSKYNYELHERQKFKAESDRNRVYMWLAIAGLIIVGFAMLSLYLRLRNQNTIIKLRGALSNIALLRQQLIMAQCGYQDESSDLSVISNTEDVKQLREQLRNELMRIYNDGKNRMGVSPVILESDAYKEIQKLIEKEKPLGDDSKIWERLEKVIKENSPKFETNLRLLTGGKLTKLEYKTAMLIKVGVTPTQMLTLLAKSKGTISSRRESICLKVFDQKMGNKVIDDVIRLM